MAITGISYQAQHNLNSGNTTPHGVAYIPSLSQIWIANNSDDDIYKYNESFTYQSKASLPSGLTQPRGLCWVASLSELWGVDTGQNRIYRMNTALASQGTYNLTNTTPEGILSFDSIGEVWVVNNSPRRIYRYNASDGSFIAYFALDNQIGDPRGGAYQPESEEAWILDQNDKIGRYNAARAFQGVYSLNSVHTFPRACVSAGNQFWVIDNGIDKAVRYNILTDAVTINQPATLQWAQNQAIPSTTLPAATGGNGTYTYTLTGLPNGLSFDATTRQLAGTPTGTGTFTLTYTATDSWGKNASISITATIKVIQNLILNPTLQILIENIDVTDRRMKSSGIRISKSLGFPQLLVSKGNRFSFAVDNSDGDFDVSTPNNFFIRAGLPANGRGGKVLVKISAHTETPTVIFAGFVVDVRSNLNNSTVIIEINDLVSSVFQSEPGHLGQTIRREITNYEGANADYDTENPVFNIPSWGLPIQRGSVSVVAPSGIQVVESINTQGLLVNTRAEIDYTRGLIRFEAPPSTGANTKITLEWRIDYRYVRPDVLVRLLLEAAELHTRLGVTDASTIAYDIDRAEIETPLPTFSSHGSPYFDREGITPLDAMGPGRTETLFCNRQPLNRIRRCERNLHIHHIGA